MVKYILQIMMQMQKSESGKIGIYDIYTETFDYINTISNNLDKILLYEDNIYVTVRGIIRI